MEKIKNWFKEEFKHHPDAFEVENKFLNEHKGEAVIHLEHLGWNILSTDRRIAFYGYRIQKGDKIYEVSLREALEMQ